MRSPGMKVRVVEPAAVLRFPQPTEQCFNPRSRVALRSLARCFNPRPPNSGGASAADDVGADHAEVSILAPPNSGGASRTMPELRHETQVSILAPRIRGAHPFARNRRTSRNFRPALREPTLELFPATPSIPRSAFAGLNNQVLTPSANLLHKSPSLHVRAKQHTTPPAALRSPSPGKFHAAAPRSRAYPASGRDEGCLPQG